MVLKLVVEQAKKKAPINPKSELREREAKAWLHLLITAGNRDKKNPEPPLVRPPGE